VKLQIKIESAHSCKAERSSAVLCCAAMALQTSWDDGDGVVVATTP
jgi:hypothetical protein